MTIHNKFNIGDIVYLKTDEEQKMRIITAIKIIPNSLLYEVTYVTQSNMFYEFELSLEEDALIKVK